MMSFSKVWTICLATLFLSAVQVWGTDVHVRFTSYPIPANFQPGSTINLICEHSPSLTFKYIVHPSIGIIAISSGRFVVTTYNNEASLVINNAMEIDEGRYRCVLRNGAATVNSEYLETFFHLPIQLPPQQGGNITVAVGDSFNLTCAGDNVILRQWLVQRPTELRQSVVTNTTDSRISITHDFVLVFRGITSEDEAMYWCVLRNEVSTRNIVANVTVVVRPVTSVTPAVQVVQEGAAANFSCRVTGVPLPSRAQVTWIDPNNMEIISSTAQNLGFTIEEVTRTDSYLISTLTFAAVSESLTGPYTCRAVNSHGTNSSTGYIRLEGTPDPPADVRLSVFNSTNIQVTWDPPNADVTLYQITWEAVTGSSAFEDPQSSSVDAAETSFIISDLHRLTTYRVTIHGINSHGMGMVSDPISATTTAVVPSAPLSVTILHYNIGSNSVHVRWSDSTLPTDNGGAPFTMVRLTYRAMEDGVWSEAWSSEEVIADVADMSAVVSSLENGTTYQIRMEVRNEIGYGPGVVSASFVTLQPGLPGSLYGVTARNLSHDSALVCWEGSSFGAPFTSYTIEIHQSAAAEPITLVFSSTDVEPFPNCSTGVLVSSLAPDTCYRFVVYASNINGDGDRSLESEDYCSTTLATPMSPLPLTVPLSIAAIAGIAVGSTVLFAIICTVIACIALRQYKKSSLKKSMNVQYMNGDSRRESEQSFRSTTGLLTNSLRTESFDSSLPPTSADSLQHSPETASTIVEQNPFDFSNRGYGGPIMMNTRSQPVLHPHQVGSEYPQGMVAERYPMYPILEDPPPYPHSISRVFPSLAQSVGHQRPPPPSAHSRYALPGDQVTNHGIIVMTDNPNYEGEQFGGVAYRAEVPRKYYSDQMSETGDSEVSANPLQIPTPHFGESYSQSGYSPVMQRSHNFKMAPGSCVKREDSGHGDSQDDSEFSREQGINLTTQKSNSDEGFDDDTEFVENDAYGTFGTPKFKIVSEERGSVFETVQPKGTS